MITLVIPTFRRPAFIVRTMAYYAASGFRGELLIGDSSEGEAAEQARAAAARHREHLRIRLVDCRNKDDRLTLHLLSTLVETPYVAYIGDDDVLVPLGLEHCRRFLDANPDYVAATGEAWTFEVLPGPVHGRLRVFAGYPQPELAQASARARFEALVRDYRVTLFALHRASTWREMWRHSAQIPDRTFSAELLPACLSPTLGKFARLDCFFLLRQGNNAAQYKLPRLDEWMATAAWRESHAAFCDHVAAAIVRLDGGELAAVRESVDAALARGYLPRFSATGGGVAPEVPGSPLRRALRAVPGARAAVRAAVRWYWQLRYGERRLSIDGLRFRWRELRDRVAGDGAFAAEVERVRRALAPSGADAGKP